MRTKVLMVTSNFCVLLAVACCILGLLTAPMAKGNPIPIIIGDADVKTCSASTCTTDTGGCTADCVNKDCDASDTAKKCLSTNTGCNCKK
jgi:hypothetical protein